MTKKRYYQVDKMSILKMIVNIRALINLSKDEELIYLINLVIDDFVDNTDYKSCHICDNPAKI